MADVEQTHPQYDKILEDWEKMRDCYDGEKAIKYKTIQYLPATPAHVYDGMASINDVGYRNYQAYLTRAVFPEYVATAVEIFIGMLHTEPATIELPEKLEYLRERASLEGDTLQGLLVRMNIEQLITGRLGILLDMPATPVAGEPTFYIAMYPAEKIRNWDATGDLNESIELEMVVLDESGWRRDGLFKWEERKQYRVLMLDEGLYKFAVVDIKEDADFKVENLQVPGVRANALKKLPFVFLNSKDISPDPDSPPLLPLGTLSLTIYRGEADYRHTLFLQGQDTLVVIGGSPVGEDEPLRVGAGARINVDEGGDAKYISVSAAGLSEQRQAIENDRKRAESRSGQLIQEQKAGVESGDALKQRLGAQTATLNQIAKASSMALENLLKIAAEWLGANPSEVRVEPNLEFGPIEVATREFVELMSAKGLGLPLSEQSMHEYLQAKKMTVLTYEEEKTLLDQEREERLQQEPEGTGLETNPEDE